MALLGIISMAWGRGVQSAPRLLFYLKGGHMPNQADLDSAHAEVDCEFERWEYIDDNHTDIRTEIVDAIKADDPEAIELFNSIITRNDLYNWCYDNGTFDNLDSRPERFE